MEKTLIEQLAEELKITKPKTKKEKVAQIVCNIDGALKAFKNESELKHFMFTERVQNVIRYDLSGKVEFPIELVTTAIK